MLKCFLCTLAAMAFTVLMAEVPKSEPAQLFAVRGGMPNLASKLASGKEVNIVFLGGSITEMGGYIPNGYVKFVGQWLREHYPNAKIKVINAGVPGTGSDYGAKRYDRDVLSRNPDAVFIEFSVNDGNSDMTTAMERMVHKSWLKNPQIDLAFFYTLDKSHLGSYKAGKLPYAAGCHERVAAFYNIPTIGAAFNAAEKINSGTIQWSDFSGDTCHPKAGGYKLFDDAFAAALPELLKNQAETPHELGKSITANLQVYPPPLKTTPLVIPSDFKTADGRKAVKVYPLPVPAENWIKEPSYGDAEGKPIWRISWLPRSEGGKLDGSTGMDKAKWDGNSAVWFEEGKCFTGPRGNGIFFGDKNNSVRLGITQGEIAVLRFIAPEGGRYEFHVASGLFDTWQKNSKPAALAALKFTWNSAKGETLMFHKEPIKESKGVRTEFATDLLAGEEVVFIPDADVPFYVGGTWNGLTIVVAMSVK